MTTKLSNLSPEPGIVYSRYASRHIAAEQCVAVHGLTYLVAGSLRVIEADKSQIFDAGSLLFSRKNFLAKFIKEPALDGPFQSITVTFDSATLHAYSELVNIGESLPADCLAAVRPLASSSLLTDFFTTLQPYFATPLPAPLAAGQPQEALRLLLQAHPALHAVLFDFGQPGKIDLEAFMRQNFRFNLGLQQLAHLTGRSLAAFKRDFAQIFHASPARWLYRRRLEEAYYLLQEEKKRPSDVYHEVGFESLAHFSHAFKQMFGRPPSSIVAGSPD